MHQHLEPHIYFEIKRKIFHLSALLLPFSYIFISKLSMCIILFILSTIILSLDTYKNYSIKIKELIEKIFSPILRSEEKEGQSLLSGASYMFIGLFITALLFPKGLTINAWFILIISDSLAAIIGMIYGQKLENGKSLAGSIAFFVSAVVVSIFSYFIIPHNISFKIIIICCLATTMVEFFSSSIRINDNFTIPFTYSLCAVILNLL
ncbi:MAG: hypothetical protein H6909_05160 [Rickettsiaceae bacterium]|nr:hypothetical protein [Rickettsiaceae bacterium]